MLARLRAPLTNRALLAPNAQESWTISISAARGTAPFSSSRLAGGLNRSKLANQLFAKSETMPTLVKCSTRQSSFVRPHAIQNKGALVQIIQIRHYRSNGRERYPWEKDDLMSKVKTGGLVLLGAGALVASTSRKSFRFRFSFATRR